MFELREARKIVPPKDIVTLFTQKYAIGPHGWANAELKQVTARPPNAPTHPPRLLIDNATFVC